MIAGAVFQSVLRADNGTVFFKRKRNDGFRVHGLFARRVPIEIVSCGAVVFEIKRYGIFQRTLPGNSDPCRQHGNGGVRRQPVYVSVALIEAVLQTDGIAL